MDDAQFDPNAAAAPGSGIFGLSSTEDSAAFVLVPVPFDATTSYRRGAAGGPDAIVEASRQIDLFDLDLGRIYESGIALISRSEAAEAQFRRWNERAGELARPIIEAGGIAEGESVQALEEVNGICAALNRQVEGEVRGLLERGKTVGLIGGDHATPFGSMAAHAAHCPGMGILHIDAHADLREAFEGFEWSHASIMFNAVKRLSGVSRLVQVGIRDFCEAEYDLIRGSGGRIRTHFWSALSRSLSDGRSWTELCRAVSEDLPENVYVSFDIDGLDPALCPNTGTPVPGGLSFDQANRLLEVVVRDGHRIVGFDLNEVAPGPDGDEWDANVGARMLYKLIGWTRMSRR